MSNVQSTSLHAYHSEVVPTLGDRQRAVYDELEKAENLTNSELAGRLNWPINCITPRVYELREVGVVVEDRRRPCRVTGRTAIAWKIAHNTLF